RSIAIVGNFGGLEIHPAGRGISHRHHHGTRRRAFLFLAHSLQCEAVMVTIALEDIGAYYGRRLTVSGITTPTFSSGEIIAVIGPNAAGKSTLFKRMAGLLQGPGMVRIEGSEKGKRAISYM